MFIFGHLGFGNKLASPWSRNLPKAPLFFGMLLPDVIDKSLYYGNQYFGGSWEIVSCTRTFGHTDLLLALIFACSALFRSKRGAALGLGMATHLLLDCLMDRFNPSEPSSALIALGWPIFSRNFTVFHFNSIGDHARHLLNAPILIAEGFGLSLLGWDYWKSANRPAMLKTLFSRRWRILKLRRLERD